MTGVELQASAKGTFQRMFRSESHVVGKSRSDEIPVPSAPRQAGQLSAAAVESNTLETNDNSETTAFMMQTSLRIEERVPTFQLRV